MTDPRRQGVLGAIVGATLGAPLTGRKTFARLAFYEPIPARMAATPSLDAWLVLARHLHRAGSGETSDAALTEGWAHHGGASAFGQANHARGLRSPLSGAFQNPLSEGGDGLGRAVLFGLALHDRPDLAAERAFFDAGFDHSGEAVWAAVALAQMVAAACAAETVAADVVRVATNTLPKGGRAAACIALALKTPPPNLVDECLAATGAADRLDAAITLASVVSGLVHGQGTFATAVCGAVGQGGAADQVGLCCGALAGLLGGVPDDWLEPLGTEYVASHVLRGLEPPDSLAFFAEAVLAEVPVHAAARAPWESPDPNWQRAEREGLAVTVRYLDGPCLLDRQTSRIALEFQNFQPMPVDVTARLAAPFGWKIASRLSSFRLGPGETAVHPAVLQCESLTADAEALLTVNGKSIAVPVVAPVRWSAIGPLPNHDGRGYDTVYAAENDDRPDATFVGRSDLPCSWEPHQAEGPIVDVEPLFRSGPGAVCLRTELALKPGRYTLVAAGSPGVVATVAGARSVAYMDDHVPVPRPIEPYTAEFEATGLTEIRIKCLRDRTPARPLVVYLLDDQGRLVSPWPVKP
jgi:hypothetical protein